MEVDSEDEVPELVKAAAKPKKKRAAEEDSDEAPESILKKVVNGEEKHQAKKQKNNAGQPVAGEKSEEPKKSKKELKKEKEAKKEEAASTNGKKVQFAEKLEQGPTPSKNAPAAKSTGPRRVNGITIDDKKLGTGPVAKKGDKVGMRYIGKLKNGKQFDANKKGKPFTFKVGTGEVIKGWDIGVAGMAVGGERRIVVPAALGYGSKAMPDLPANSELTFDLKMISIN
jgi:FK506-binding nuclear protein